MIRKFKFDYDYDNDNLFMYDPKSKSKASIEIDDMIIDFNTKNEVSGIELLNASKFFTDLKIGAKEIDKELFNEIKSCNIDIIPKGNFFVIKFILSFQSNIQIQTPVYVPIIHESSPSLANIY